MLKLLKRWLGWEADSDYYVQTPPPARGRPASATAHLFKKQQPAAGTSRGAPQQRVAPSARQKPRRKTDPVVKPDPNFDPYNTGKFDRSASWERISKNQR